MSLKKYILDEEKISDLHSQVASIQAVLRNDGDLEKIKKYINILDFLLKEVKEKNEFVNDDKR